MLWATWALPTRPSATRATFESCEQALGIHREIGDRRGEATDLYNLADELFKLGDRDQAIANAETALAIFEQIEDPRATEVRRQLEEWRNKAS